VTVIGPWRPDVLSPLHAERAERLRAVAGLKVEVEEWAVENSSPGRAVYLVGYARTEQKALRAAETLRAEAFHGEQFRAAETAVRAELWAPAPAPRLSFPRRK
jgi:hypothetical protein